MADNHTPEVRSFNMSRIKSKDTQPEIWLRKQLFRKGYRYRKNVKSIPGKPDLFLRKYNTAIFVNGCFWHRHAGCKYSYTPKSRAEYWNNKFDSNIQRDQENQKRLTELGIKWLIVWECTINKMKRDEDYASKRLAEIAEFLASDSRSFEL